MILFQQASDGTALFFSGFNKFNQFLVIRAVFICTVVFLLTGVKIENDLGRGFRQKFRHGQLTAEFGDMHFGATEYIPVGRPTPEINIRPWDDVLKILKIVAQKSSEYISLWQWYPATFANGPRPDVIRDQDVLGGQKLGFWQVSRPFTMCKIYDRIHRWRCSGILEYWLKIPYNFSRSGVLNPGFIYVFEDHKSSLHRYQRVAVDFVGISEKTTLPKGNPSIYSDGQQRENLGDELLAVTGLVFFALCAVLLCKVRWSLSFNFASDSNAAGYVALIIGCAVIILIGMRLIGSGFGLISIFSIHGGNTLIAWNNLNTSKDQGQRRTSKKT